MSAVEKRRLSRGAKLLNIRKAMEVRTLQCEPNAPFDPIRFIEFILPSLIKNFEYCVDERDRVFCEAPSTQAYVDLTSNPVLVARESVVERALKGSFNDRFILSHEIAHVIRHRNSGKVLAQHKLNSPERNRAHKYFEMEANLFGGTLLAPPNSRIEAMTIRQASEHFQVSEYAASIAIADAAFWRQNSGDK